jgi:hypothetical protein
MEQVPSSPHIYSVSKQIVNDRVNTKSENLLTSLPSELILLIFQKLNEKQSINLAKVCKKLNDLYIKRNSFWEHKKLENLFDQYLKEGFIERSINSKIKELSPEHFEKVFKEKKHFIQVRNYEEYTKIGKLIEQVKVLDLQEQQKLTQKEDLLRSQQTFLSGSSLPQMITKITNLYNQILKKGDS